MTATTTAKTPLRITRKRLQELHEADEVCKWGVDTFAQRFGEETTVTVDSLRRIVRIYGAPLAFHHLERFIPEANRRQFRVTKDAADDARERHQTGPIADDEWPSEPFLFRAAGGPVASIYAETIGRAFIRAFDAN